MKSKLKNAKRSKADAPTVEIEPDAWERFEKAVAAVAPPKRPKPKEPEKSNRRR